MVISGKGTERFDDANYAVLRKKWVEGSWKSASTNENWDLFWCEITAFDPDEGTVELAKTDEPHDIEEDELGEYIEIGQEHHSVFTDSDQYLTRFRPYIENSTEKKPWMEGDR